MAKTPSAKVPKTSGQGVSRLSYQKSYSLGNRGTGSPGKGASGASVKSERAESKSVRSSSGKGKIDSAAGMNVSYGDTLFPSSLDDVVGLGKRQPPKSPGFFKLGKKLKFKEGKDDSGFLKGKK